MASVFSQSTNSDQQEGINDLINSAYRLLTEESIQSSIQAYQQCVRQYPKCWRAYQNLGVAYIMNKDYQNANQVLKTYVTHVPRDPLGHDSLGVSYSELNDPLQAIASFVNSINLAPTYYMSYYNLGVVLGKLGLYDYALNAYNHCLLLYPNYVNALNNVADIFKKIDRIDEAIDIFKQVIELDPSYSLGLKNLGNCYFAKEDFIHAIGMYLKVLQIQKQSQSAQYNLALCLNYYGLNFEAGKLVLKSFQNSFDKQSTETLVKIFVAGNMFWQQTHRLYLLLKIALKFHKKHVKLIKRQILMTYNLVLKTYTKAAKLLPWSQEILCNIKSVKQNLACYEIKLGESFGQKRRVDLHFGNCPEKRLLKKKASEMVREIIKWRGKTKRLIYKLNSTLTEKQQAFELEKQQVHGQFGTTNYYPFCKLQFKSYRYVSRARHDSKRIILQRFRFIKKYNKIDQEINSTFKLRKIFTTLTDPGTLNEKSSSNPMIAEEENQFEARDF